MLTPNSLRTTWVPCAVRRDPHPPPPTPFHKNQGTNPIVAPHTEGTAWFLPLLRLPPQATSDT